MEYIKRPLRLCASAVLFPFPAPIVGPTRGRAIDDGRRTMHGRLSSHTASTQSFDSLCAFCDNRLVLRQGRSIGVRGYISVVLITYGAVGVAVHLRLLPLLATALTAWLGLPVASDSPAQWA